VSRISRNFVHRSCRGRPCVVPIGYVMIQSLPRAAAATSVRPSFSGSCARACGRSLMGLAKRGDCRRLRTAANRWLVPTVALRGCADSSQTSRISVVRHCSAANRHRQTCHVLTVELERSKRRSPWRTRPTPTFEGEVIAREGDRVSALQRRKCGSRTVERRAGR
jgi:hypothetical protein